MKMNEATIKATINRVCMLKETIAVMEGEIDRQKELLYELLVNEGITQETSDYGKASIMSFTRGTLNGKLTMNALDALQNHTAEGWIGINDCKQYKDINFVMIKRHPDMIIPMVGENIE